MPMEDRCAVMTTAFGWAKAYVRAMGSVSFGNSREYTNQQLVDDLHVEQVLDEWPSTLTTTVQVEINFLKHLHECLLTLIGSLIHHTGGAGGGGRRQCMILLFRYQLNAATPLRQQLIKNVNASLLHDLAAASTKIEAVAALAILVAQCVRINSSLVFIFQCVCVLVVTELICRPSHSCFLFSFFCCCYRVVLYRTTKEQH